MHFFPMTYPGTAAATPAPKRYKTIQPVHTFNILIQATCLLPEADVQKDNAEIRSSS